MAGSSFCCQGCESVFCLLQSKGLARFYDLRREYSFAKPRTAALDLPSSDLIGNTQRFYIEGIHCLGCLWLLEKLPEIDNRILSAQLDVAHSILTVRIDSGKISWSEATGLISQLGYLPKAFADEGASARAADIRVQLIRLGVAAFSAANVMLLAAALYSGAGAQWGDLFRWLSAALAAPALLYSAYPIYRSSILPLRYGRISVDLAITAAIFSGIALSLLNLIQGSSEIFFDSLSMLVFLLLSSRYLLNRFREQLGLESPFLQFFSSERFARLSPSPGIVTAQMIQPGEIFLLKSGQTLPADSTLLSTIAYFDLSLLTGESLPNKSSAHEKIDAGAKLVSRAVRVECRVPANESRLSKILQQIHSFQLLRSPSLDLAERMGKYFVAAVLLISAAIIYAMPNSEGIHRALALVIVTCPCVLAFSVPLALSRSLQNAAKLGLLFRSPDKIEALACAKKFFLDKTGTLTNGDFSVKKWENFGNEAESFSIAHSLESRSSHPVARAILRHTAGAKLLSGTVEEISGLGVKGIFSEKNWRIERSTIEPAAGDNLVDLYSENELRARITLGDSLRPESVEAVRKLLAKGLDLAILSGDSEASVAATATFLGIKEWHSRLLPEEKAKLVESCPGSAMVGDGANDAVAFQAASVGIAVQGAIELSLKNSDLALSRQGISSLLPAIEMAENTMRIIRANFSVTLFYNLVAGTLAITGFMSPLLAAILMPASALTVFAYTQWRTGGSQS